MEFLANTVDYNGVEAGENAQFGPTSHDNGGTVFPYYQNFGSNTLGGALPAGWTTTTQTTLSYQSAYLGVGSTTNTAFNGISLPATLSMNTVGNTLEAYMELTAPGNGFLTNNQGFQLANANIGKTAVCFSAGEGIYTSKSDIGICHTGRGYGSVTVTDFANPHWYSTSLAPFNSIDANELAYVDYSFPATLVSAQLTKFPDIKFNYLDIMSENVIAYSQVYIVRARVNPTLNNIMPSAALGSLSHT